LSICLIVRLSVRIKAHLKLTIVGYQPCIRLAKDFIGKNLGLIFIVKKAFGMTNCHISAILFTINMFLHGRDAVKKIITIRSDYLKIANRLPSPLLAAVYFPRPEQQPLQICRIRPKREENPLSFYVKRRRKIHFPQMSETAILQQEPAMTSEVKLSETETICMLDRKSETICIFDTHVPICRAHTAHQPPLADVQSLDGGRVL
jgi:hypothetical protein